MKALTINTIKESTCKFLFGIEEGVLSTAMMEGNSL